MRDNTRQFAVSLLVISQLLWARMLAAMIAVQECLTFRQTRAA